VKTRSVEVNPQPFQDSLVVAQLLLCPTKATETARLADTERAAVSLNEPAVRSQFIDLRRAQGRILERYFRPKIVTVCGVVVQVGVPGKQAHGLRTRRSRIAATANRESPNQLDHDGVRNSRSQSVAN